MLPLRRTFAAGSSRFTPTAFSRHLTTSQRTLTTHTQSRLLWRTTAQYLQYSSRPTTCRAFTTSPIFLKSTAPSPPPTEETQQEPSPKPDQDSAKFSSSDTKEDEAKEKEKKKEDEKEKPPPPPPHGDKTPWMVFRDTLKSEFEASKEWNESTKALASSAHQFSESDTVRRAREAYEASQKVTGAAASATGKAAGAVAGAMGKGAAWTWETPVVKAGRTVARMSGQGVAAATRPLRETEVYKNVKGSVKDVIDDGSSSRYGGFLEREERKKAKEARELKRNGGKPLEKMVEDPEAGTNVTLHKDAAWKESWREFRDSNKVMQSIFSLKRNYEDSENPLIAVPRNIADRVAGFFAENETARVIKAFKAMDPSFQLEAFLRELREYILPEVLDAYVKGDSATLMQWLSAAQFSVYSALAQQTKTAGLRSDGRVLDIRGVDIITAKILEPGDIPVFIVTCRAQEVHVYRDVKTGNLAAGMEDRVQQVTYAIGITRMPEDVANPETGGWRLIELQKSGRDYI